MAEPEDKEEKEKDPESDDESESEEESESESDEESEEDSEEEDASESVAEEDDAEAEEESDAEPQEDEPAGDASESDAQPDEDGAAEDAAESDAEPEEDGSDEDGPAEPNRARDVARALGVSGEAEDGEEASEEGEKPEVLNRAERRRRRALRRRKGADADVSEATPKDRNKARREELLKRRRAAAGVEVEDDSDVPPDKLLPSEMVDDALARGRAAAWRWITGNWKVLQWVLTAAIVGGAATLAWFYFQGRGEEKASDGLATGVWAEEATVLPPDKDERPEDQKKNDIRELVPSYEERDNKALAAYRLVASDHGGSGAAILARLGEAGVLLDQREWDAAISAFDQVIESPLAAADLDVKGRALEGKAFAQEGKKDLDGALATFTKLGDLASDVYKALSLYHQGRIYLVKEQKDQAKAKLLEARTITDKAKVDARMVAAGHPYRWLERAVTDELVIIDPSFEPEKPGTLSPEKLQELLRQQGLDTEGGIPGLPGMPEGMPLPEEPE